MFINIHDIRLLREIIRSYHPPGLGFLVCFLASIVSKRYHISQATHKTKTHSSSSTGAPFLNPPCSPSSSPSSSLSRFLLRFTSPLFSLATSIPRRARLSLLSSMRSAILTMVSVILQGEWLQLGTRVRNEVLTGGRLLPRFPVLVLALDLNRVTLVVRVHEAASASW